MNERKLNFGSPENRIFSIDRGISFREDDASGQEIPESLKLDGVGRLFTASEVAELLGVSRSAVYRLIEGGEIPSFRVGRLVRVEEYSLVRYIRAKGA